ncbi:hypothetical protein GCM10007108_14680 [Thermogymnomonas acidicola]|uniref:DUF4382 domain-containing protein n=1 Tax=Thermogymnomonas acidicola TaxID=399579 RepID=A0AA37FA22_9ARCH|nr:hypothetical protein GCM10007108_14680 [Thermogymnomonas acidicola]
MLAALVIVVVAAVAGGGYYYYSNVADTGHLALAAADAPPSSQVFGVYITFDAVAVHSTTSGWQNFSFAARTLNILNVTPTSVSLFTSDTVANLTLHAGNYTMIRIYITNVTVDILGSNITFRLASDFAFVNHPFTVTAGGTVMGVIEFNLNSDLNLNSRVFTPNIGFVVNGSS